MASLRQGDVLIHFFLLLTGGLGFEQRRVSLAVRQKGRILWGRPLCVITITKATERKSKKQFQQGVRIDFSLQQLHLQELIFCKTVLGHLYRRRQQKGPWSWLEQPPPAWASRLAAGAVIKSAYRPFAKYMGVCCHSCCCSVPGFPEVYIGIGFGVVHTYIWVASQVVLVVKSPPANAGDIETCLPSRGRACIYLTMIFI